jgi:glutamyl-Q tRNA(Asp) synthetase
MIVTRFAPSPTGYLHLGHAFAAMTAHDAARGGRFRLRIEDLDAARSRAEFVDAIMEDLRWLGLCWEEPVMRQSERLPVYRAALDRLAADGLLYPCFCTRAEIAAEIARAADAPQGPDGPLYPGTCRDLSLLKREKLLGAGVPYALRLDSCAAAARIFALTFEEIKAGRRRDKQTIPVDPLLFGDVVLARKETPASYHLAVVLDDAEQGVTLVTRGSDLLGATHVQRVLQALLEISAPRYAHHRLILDSNGRKLSKRDAAVSLRSLREQGVTASEIRARLFVGVD